MKTNFTLNRLTKLALVPLALVLFLLGGCLEKKLLWSPDGNRAAVLGPDGLQLCDADGKLSPLLVPGAYRAAWLSDSQQLVVARLTDEHSWSAFPKALGPEQTARVIARAESIWQQIQTSGLWGVLTMDINGKGGSKLIKIYLRDHYGEALRAKVDASEWDAIKGETAEIHQLVMARIENGKITTSSVLHESLGTVMEIRTAPGDRAVAFITETGLPAEGQNKDDLQLFVARLNSPEATLVATHCGAFPDWTADGRFLVYTQAASDSTKDDLQLGTLVRREVLDATGAIAIKKDKNELAGWIFSVKSRVRCLKDGRIIFNAAEISLPIAADDYGEQHEQLFAIDQARQSTLVRLIPRKREEELPQTLAFFEISPDEKQVLFGSYTGEVGVLTLATGEVEKVQEAGQNKHQLQGQPVWRKDGEFSYTRRTVMKDGQTPVRKTEVVLRRAGKEKVLSETWPDAMVNELFSDRY